MKQRRVMTDEAVDGDGGGGAEDMRTVLERNFYVRMRRGETVGGVVVPSL